MNNVYIYDGNFITLLNLILYLLKNQLKPENIQENDYNPSLFEQPIYLTIDNDLKIIDKMINNFGKFVMRSMYYVHLSDEKNKELILYYFFSNALKYRHNIMKYRNLKCVSEVLRISYYVSHEVHKMKGFLRFKEYKKNILYAEMEPTNDILFLVSCHFVKRLKNEFWVIKDNKRKIISMYDKHQFIIVREEEFTLTLKTLSKEEKDIENLWCLFYKTIGIKERKNDRCRRNFMPKKYWQYITEMKEDL